MKFDKKIFFLALFLVGQVVWAQVPEGEAELPSAEEIETEPENTQPPSGGPVTGEEKPEEKIEGEVGEEELVYLNVQDQDIKEVIKQISKATARNFIIDEKVAGKVTILSHKMMTREEAYQAFLSALSVAGFTTVEGPAGILKIVPLRDAKNFPIPTHVDTTPYTDNFVTKLINLENISANEMAEAIKGLISKNGNLFAYPETNTLVLTDSGTNIDRLMKIIKELDQSPQKVVEIIPVHYASAKDIAGILLSLFEEQKQAARGGRRPEGAVSGEELPEVSKIIADERTNALIVLASLRSIDKVRALINRLDAKLEEGAEGKIHVHYLKYAKAKDIASVLQSLSGVVSKPPAAAGGAKPAEAGTVVAELEDFKVAADETTNSLLITSTPKTYRTLDEKVLSKLDIPRKQVYLEAMVVEFVLTRKKEWGISGHGGIASGDVLGMTQTLGGLKNLFDPTGASFLGAPGILGGILARKTVDVKVLDSSGTAKTFTVPAFSAFLTALNSFGDTNIIASPNLLALDNEESSIEIITKEPEPGQTTITGTGLSQTGPPSRIEAGLKLKLTPQITERGSVRMKIDQSFSSFIAPQNPELKTQAIRERKVATSVITSDGQTVVIGGLMEDKIDLAKTKVPILGDIPLLGYLFQQKKATKSKGNLLLFITPHIIRDSGDFEKVLSRKVGQQDEFLAKNFKTKDKKDIEAIIHGHNKDLLDILERRPAAADASVTQGTVERLQTTPPVITAKPEEEPLTIVLPSKVLLEEEPSKKELKEQKKREKEESKEVQVPEFEIIPASPKEESKALPPPPPPPPAAVREAPAPESQKKKKKPEERAPIIILPPGTPPDWQEE